MLDCAHKLLFVPAAAAKGKKGTTKMNFGIADSASRVKYFIENPTNIKVLTVIIDIPKKL